jgi:hypothetical protein
MKYYKVENNKFCHAFGGRYYKDNVNSYKLKNGIRTSCQYIADELITPAELKKIYGITADNIKNFPFLKPVEIKKTETHYFFGARFADNRPIYYTATGEAFTE